MSDTTVAALPGDALREGVVSALRDALGDALLDSLVKPNHDVWVRVRTDAWRQAGLVLRDRLGVLSEGEDVEASGLVWEVADADCWTYPLPGSLTLQTWRATPTGQVQVSMHPPQGGLSAIKPQFLLGILLAAIGGCLVTLYKPDAPAPAKAPPAQSAPAKSAGN